jgi:hypothetical protein
MLKESRKQGGWGSRLSLVERYGVDTKYAYHVVRLLNEIEQILVDCDLSLDQNREQLKDIRAGEWSAERIKTYFETKERELKSVYLSSTLQHGPDEKAIKTLLLQCLEEYYGSLEDCIEIPDAEREALRTIDKALDTVRHRL